MEINNLKVISWAYRIHERVKSLINACTYLSLLCGKKPSKQAGNETSFFLVKRSTMNLSRLKGARKAYERARYLCN